MFSIKGVSVGIEDLQIYCIYYKQNIFYLHELFETGILIYYPAVSLSNGFFFHPMTASWKSVCDSFPLIPAVPPLVGGVSVFFIRQISRKLIETQIFDMKSCFLGCQYFITN